jgi:two-component system sensor histidine kinase DesK
MADLLRQGNPSWIAAIHLLWSVWVFIVPVFTSHGYDLRWALLTLLSYPLFLALYWGAFWLPRRWITACALGLIILCLALLPWYPSGLSYFVYGCILLGGGAQRSLWIYLAQLLALNLSLIVWEKWLNYDWSAFVWMPVTTLAIGLLTHFDRINQRRDAALRLSHEEVRRLAASAERERIGRDLHDLLGHTLSLITLKLELARKLSERDPASARREMEEAERVAREALAQVRSAVTGIRSTGIVAELASARLLLETSLVHLEYDTPPPLPEDVERMLALVLREAVTNIARHARATQARITFAHEPGAMRVRIEDNGRGGANSDGNGLRGMRERIATLDGTLSIESSKEQGTRLRLWIPCKPLVTALTTAAQEPLMPAEARPRA